MDGFPVELPIFLVATFAGALVAGLSGFAFGLVAASIWLYILTPLQTATLIVAFGLIVQGYSVWKLRHALELAKFWPFILGAAIGVPVGIGQTSNQFLCVGKKERARNDRERSGQAGTVVATGCPKMECENTTGL